MKLVKPSVERILGVGGDLTIEIAARTCYKSEDKITNNTSHKMVEELIKNGHHAMLEFGWMFYKVICDRGVTHEIVRHRLFSYAQESTRYCNYKGGVTFVIPCWFGENDLTESGWRIHMQCCEDRYLDLLNNAWTPQQARSVLPNSLKTEICIAGNLREWRHFFKLRCAKTAHPQMQEVAQMIYDDSRRFTDDSVFKNI